LAQKHSVDRYLGQERRAGSNLREARSKYS